MFGKHHEEPITPSERVRCAVTDGPAVVEDARDQHRAGGVLCVGSARLPEREGRDGTAICKLTYAVLANMVRAARRAICALQAIVRQRQSVAVSCRKAHARNHHAGAHRRIPPSVRWAPDDSTRTAVNDRRTAIRSWASVLLRPCRHASTQQRAPLLCTRYTGPGRRAGRARAASGAWRGSRGASGMGARTATARHDDLSRPATAANHAGRNGDGKPVEGGRHA
jgi:hypothetical protein